MTIDAKLMIGSILAPGATVNLNQNLNGTCVADTIYVKAESHRDDSRGTTPNTPTEEKGSLTFTKTFGGDNITKADLSNISFTVTGPNNYSKTFTLGEIKQNDGTYSKTLTGLTLGKYTVTEKNADQVEGYSLVKEGTITSGETTLTTTSKTATIALNDNYQPNKPEQPTEEKGSLTFTKTFGGDNITKADLSNISFTVTGPNNYSKTFTLGEIKQNDGTYSKTLTDLTLGKYTVTENNADKVDGYTLVTNESVTSKGTTVEKNKNVTVDLKDAYTPNQTTKKYALKVRKTENIDKKDTNKRIRGSRYAMFRWTGQIAAADAQDNALLSASLRVSNVATTAAADQKDPYARFRDLTRADITAANGWKEIVSSDTDANGEIKADSASNTDITPGIYAIMEQTPPAGYQRTANPAIIRLKEDGTKKMISNANGAAELETEGAVQFLRWRETATNVEIAKVDENGKPVKGAILAVYDKDGKLIESWTTDGTAHRITAKLIAGDT
ncbi:MAG: hypothetical protein DUD26_05615 [Eubacteriaceae bacterium]|nr:MAG: hypothetical protein DUD26_05615 [Eubacteriaceae bacterium]